MSDHGVLIIENEGSYEASKLLLEGRKSIKAYTVAAIYSFRKVAARVPYASRLQLVLPHPLRS